MKKNIVLKNVMIILFTLSLFITILFNNYKVEATGFDAASFEKFEQTDDDLEITEVTDTMDNITEIIMTVIRIVAVTIALVMLLVIGMKYMIASPGERADIKKHAVAYVIGAFILFGVSGILSILLEFANQIAE